MHFSITCGLFLCVTMLFSLPGQGRLDPNLGGLRLPCCPKVSPAAVQKSVKECYEQLPNTVPQCKVHAYIFVTSDDKQYCVDPNASWFQNRLDKLEKKGIHCSRL